MVTGFDQSNDPTLNKSSILSSALINRWITDSAPAGLPQIRASGLMSPLALGLMQQVVHFLFSWHFQPEVLILISFTYQGNMCVRSFYDMCYNTLMNKRDWLGKISGGVQDFCIGGVIKAVSWVVCQLLSQSQCDSTPTGACPSVVLATQTAPLKNKELGLTFNIREA